MNFKSKNIKVIFSLICAVIMTVTNVAAQNQDKNSLNQPIPAKARELLTNAQKLAIEQDKINEGLAQIKEAIRLAPNFVAAHAEYLRLRAYFLDESVQVQSDYENLMSKDPNNAVYPLALANGLTFATSKNKISWYNKAATLAIGSGWEHFAKAREGEFSPILNIEVVADEYSKAIEKDPTEPQFYVYGVPVIIRAKKLDQAAALLEKMPSSVDLPLKMNLRWDLRLARENNSAEALEKLKIELAKLLETTKDTTSLKAVRQRYKRLKIEDKLKETETKIAALDQNWYPEQGEIKFTISFEQEIKRSYFGGRQNQINTRLQKVDGEAAALVQIGQIEPLLKLNPNIQNQMLIYGRLLVLAMEAKDAERAAKYGELHLKAAPNKVSTLARLAEVYAGDPKKNIAKALEYSSLAMELSKDFRLVSRPADMEERTFNAIMPEKRQREYHDELRAIVLGSRAFVLESDGKVAEAEILLREAVGMRPNENTYIQLEKVLRKLGRIAEADAAAVTGANFWRDNIKASFKTEPAKDFELMTVKGDKIKLSALKGKIVWINYWATWCEPCIKEMPLMVELYDKYKAQGLEILAVSVDTPEDRLKIPSFIKKTQMNFPVLYDESSAQAYGVSSFPTSIFVDREGNVRYRTKGLDAHHARRNLEFVISELLKNGS